TSPALPQRTALRSPRSRAPSSKVRPGQNDSDGTSRRGIDTPLRAATLLGAAHQLRVAVGVSVWGSQLARRERLVARLRTTLGAAVYANASARGAAMRYSEALDAVTEG